MAQFRGTVKGNRSEASRLGHKTTGLRVECNGWNVGVECVAKWDEQTQKDVILIFKTSGSSKSRQKELISIIEEGK